MLTLGAMSTVTTKKEYEALLALKRIREFTPTASQKKALLRAENNFRKGKTLSYRLLAQKRSAA